MKAAREEQEENTVMVEVETEEAGLDGEGETKLVAVERKVCCDDGLYLFFKILFHDFFFKS